MKHSEILREAKKHLWNGTGSPFFGAWQEYICHAINVAVKMGSPDLTDDQIKGKELKDWIEEMLYRDADTSVYTLWFLKTNDYNSMRSHRTIQRGRLQWMDEMIVYLEGLGK
jgi:hypothetical protein